MTMTASAAKRGRNPRFPYVPVIKHAAYPDQKGGMIRERSEQIQGKAFETRDAAVIYAEYVIDYRRSR